MLIERTACDSRVLDARGDLGRIPILCDLAKYRSLPLLFYHAALFFRRIHALINHHALGAGLLAGLGKRHVGIVSNCEGSATSQEGVAQFPRRAARALFAEVKARAVEDLAGHASTMR